MIACAAAAVVIAWAVYRPDRARPFDFLDFGEFLPLVRGASDFTSQVSSIVDYNAGQSGRANLVQIVIAVMKWRLFGFWTPGWQLAHAAVMLVVVAQAYLLLRRLDATKLGAVIGASVFLIAPAAARGFVRLTMGEPVGMIAVFAMALRATRFQGAQRWFREAWFFAFGTVFVLLTKEVMAPALLFPLAIALTLQPEGGVGGPRWTSRNRVLVLMAGVAALVTLIPLAQLYFQATTSALASQYGRAWQSPGGVLAICIATLVPFHLVPTQTSVMWALAVGGLAFLLSTGWRHGLHDPVDRRRARWLLSGALLFPFAGALAYAPWPAYDERYAYPYLVATSLLAGMAASYLQRASPNGTLWAAVSWGPVALFAASGAAAYASRADAVQRASDAVVEAVASAPNIDSVVFATAWPTEPAWTGLGPTFFRLAAATDRPWPPTREVRCASIPRILEASDRTAIVAFASHCGAGLRGTQSVTAVHRSGEWSRWRMAVDTVRAEIFTARK